MDIISLPCICFLPTLGWAKGHWKAEMLVKDWAMGDVSEAGTDEGEGAITPAGLVNISF